MVPARQPSRESQNGKGLLHRLISVESKLWTHHVLPRGLPSATMAVSARLPIRMLMPSRRQARRHLEELKRDVDRQKEEERLSELIWEAREFLEDFVRSRWESYMHSITIQCDLTLAEVRELGRLPKAEGTRACRRLICVPVINDEIGHALWLKLAKDIQKDTQQAEGSSEKQQEKPHSIEKRPSRLRALSLPIATISRSPSDLFAERARRRYSAPGKCDTKSSACGITKRGGRKMSKATGHSEHVCVFCHDQSNACAIMARDVPLPEHNRAHSFRLKMFTGEDKFWKAEENGKPSSNRRRFSSSLKRSAARFFTRLGETLAEEDEGMARAIKSQ